MLLKDLNSVPEKIRTAVRNNGGGHYNHSLFWQMMSKTGGGEPKGELAKAIDRELRKLQRLQRRVHQSRRSGEFGSGWAWLIVNPDGKLAIESHAESGLRRISHGCTPLLGVDVWEHAYYLKYQNKRADYVAAWFNVINWDFVSERFSHGGSA